MSELHCNREKEIDKLLADCETIKAKENNLEMSIQKLDDKLNNHIDNMENRFNTVDSKLSSIETILDKYGQRITGLEKTVLIVKWSLIGASIVLLAINGGNVGEFFIKILTKGV